MAPLLTFFVGTKNAIVEATLATKGFAEALGTAWTVAKAMFAAATAATVISLGNSIKNVFAFATALRAANTAALGTAATVASLAEAQALGAAAATAFGNANVLSAASLKAQALWVGISARAMALHQAALATATAGTAGFSIATYVASVATGTLAGALGLLRTVAVTLAGGALRSLWATMLANPILTTVAAVSAATVAFTSWAEAVAKTNEEYIDLVQNAAKATRALREQADAVRTLDDYRAALAATDAEEARITKQIRDLGPRPNDDVTYTAGGAFKNSNPSDAQLAFDEKKKALGQALGTVRATHRKLAGRDINSLGLSKEEEQAAVESADRESRLRDAREQAEIDRADDAGRERGLRARAARLAAEATEGARIAEGRLRPEKFKNDPTALMKAADEIKALTDAKQNVPGSLLQKRADLANLGNTFQEKRAAALQDANEADRLAEGLRIKKLEIVYDKEIARIRATGASTAQAEAAKELAILKEQLRIAQEKGKAGELDAKQIAARIAQRESEMAKFQVDAGLDRATNNALINQNPKAAEALQDARERERMRDQYRANGMTMKQADSDFAAGILGKAAQAQPRIVADSMQSIGGGGGSGGSSPILAALQRIAAIGEAQKKIQEAMASGLGGLSGTIR